jgi:conjugal transfer/type IV secretion protein DotA/TraY
MKRALGRAGPALVGLALALTATTARAAEFSPFSVSKDDLSLRLLTAIFGGVFDDAAGPGAFAAYAGVVAGAALLIAGCMTAYVFLAGTMATAHQAEVLGKRWSSMWVPIRLSVGVGLAIPVKGGLCAAHLLVAWLVTQSIGLANTGWKAFSDSYLEPGQTVRSMPSPNVEATAYGMLKSATCVLMIREVAAGPDTAEYYGPGSAGSGARGTFKPGDTRSYGTPSQPNACGSVSTPASGFAEAMDSPSYNEGAGNSGTVGFATGAADAIRIAGKIAESHTAQSSVLESRMFALAAEIRSAGQISPAVAAAHRAEFNDAVADYKEAVGKATLRSMRTEEYWETQRQAAARDGWLVAGAWGVRLSQVANAGAGALSSAPTWAETAGMNGDKDLAASQALLASVIPPISASPTHLAVGAQVQRDDLAGLEGDGDSGFFGWLKKLNPANLAQEISDKAAGVLGAKIRDAMSGSWKDTSTADFSSARNPMISGIEAGHTLIAAAVTALLVFTAIVFALPGGAAVAASLGWFVKGAVGVTMAAGTVLVSLAYVPYLLWMAAMLGWVVLVAEALISAPLWAIGHTHAEGDGIAGAAAPGYSVLLSLTLRPVLLVGGLVCATLIVTPISHIVDMTFGAVVSFSAIGNSAGLVVQLVGLSIFVALKLGLVYGCYKLIHVVPDQVLRYLAFGGHGQGMVGQAVEGMGLGGGKAAAAAAGAGLAKLAGGAVGGASAAAGGGGGLKGQLGKLDGVAARVSQARSESLDPSKSDQEAAKGALGKLDEAERGLDSLEKGGGIMARKAVADSGMRESIAQARRDISSGAGRPEANAEGLRQEAAAQTIKSAKFKAASALREGNPDRMRDTANEIEDQADSKATLLEEGGVRQMASYASSLRSEADRIDPPEVR